MSEWRTLFRQIIALGYLDVNVERYGALQLTQQCRPLLRGEETLELRKQLKEQKTEKKTKQKGTIRVQDEALWQALRQLRSRLAEEAGVPPYVIFHDATLQEMLKQRPGTENELGRISGVGDQKLSRYGKIFIEEISLYPLPELLDNQLSTTVNETLILFEQGKNIQQIATTRDLNTTTVYTHFADAIETGLLM